MSIKTLQAVRGMNDILPDEAEHWALFEALASEVLHAYGFRPIRLPLLEHTGLFKRAIGEVTDIVEKEMYAFEDRLNGEQLTLRPEGTAPCVRAAIEHGLLHQGGQRLYYMGPMFRHERPQKGRSRQFHQIGVEALGFAGPDTDAELILMGARLWSVLGLDSKVKLELNSLGEAPERAAHRQALIAYFEQHQTALDEDAKRRLYTNPLRILDTKNPAMQDLVERAPRLDAFWGEESRAHFNAVLSLLEEAGVAYTINPRLVRGLDYYNRTVFEWTTDRLGAQGTICAGGRYDGLVEQLGGKPTAAAGFALGIERVMMLWRETAMIPQANYMPPDVYVTHMGPVAQRLALRVAQVLRDEGFSVMLHYGTGSVKSQMKKADASLACLAVIIGEDEVQSEEVSIKPLRKEGEQVRVALTQMGETVENMILEMKENGNGCV